MPLFTDSLRAGGAGLIDNPRPARPWDIALHFINYRSGASLGTPWGALLRGYGDIGLPGFESVVTEVDTVDNITGLSTPYESGRNPSVRQVALHLQMGNRAHAAIANTAQNQRLVTRHIGPPPQMDLTHSVDLVSSRGVAVVNAAGGAVVPFGLRSVALPVTIPGVFYSVENYSTDSSGGLTSATGTTLARAAGDQALAGDDDAGTDTALDSHILKLDAATHVFSLDTDAADLPAGYTRRAAIISPGVGYAVSDQDNNTTQSPIAGRQFSEMSFAADEGFADAVIAETPALYLAIWQWPSARGAL